MAIIKVRNPAIDLDAAEIPNIDASKITSGSLGADRIPGLAASKITTGTFDDARIAASNVSQHATSFDDNKLVNDISTLALRQASDQNKSAYNTNSQSVDVFQDATGIDTTTNAQRDASEYVSSVNNLLGSFSLNTADRSSEGIVMSFSGFTPSGTSTNVDNVWFDGATVYSDGSDEDWYFPNSNANTPSNIISIDMGSSYNKVINSFRLYLGNGIGCGVWKFQGSNDNSNFTDLLSSFTWQGTSGSGQSFYSDFDFTNTTKYRYFRFVGVSGNISSSPYQNSIMLKEASITQTVSATGNFTGTTITAPSSVSEMGAIITYQDNAGTNALNTDIVLQLSADGGSNYSTATLTALPDFSTGIKMAKVNDLAVTAGTQLKYKINFANQASGSKEARIRGVALQY